MARGRARLELREAASMRMNMQVVGVVVALGLVGGCSSGKTRSTGNAGSGGTTGAAGSGGSGGTAGAAGNASGGSAGTTPGQDAGQCASVAMADCAATAGCQVLSAQRIYNDCVGPRTDVGCGALGCGALMTRATDPNGNDWLFPSTCIPAGWKNATGASSLPECSDAGADSGGAGAGGADAGP